MLIHTSRVKFCNAFRKRNAYCTNILNFTNIRKVQTSPKVPLSKDPLYYFNSLFDSSAKQFLDISKIHLLDKYFESRSELKCTYNFVINESVAKDIVDKIFSDMNTQERIFYEGNPGVGLITINLINAHATQVHVLDNSELDELALVEIVKNHPNVVTRQFGNLNKDVTLILRSFDDAKKNDLTATFILVATSCYFIRLMVTLFLKYELWSTNFEMYLILSDAVYQSLKNFTPIHLKFLIYCGFNLLFVAKKIATYPSTAFLPVCKNSEQNMNFVKISKNPKAYIKEDEFVYYVVFISILGRKSTNFIIPTLEIWLPGCGPYLISQGISMTNQVRDLSFEDSITLFKLFQNCEGYKDFKACTLKIFEETQSS